MIRFIKIKKLQNYKKLCKKMKKNYKTIMWESVKKMNINFNDINIPKPYIPEELPINLDSVLLNREMFDLITTASNEMGIYKGFLSNTPNPMLLISPLSIQEAVLSSKIEGTHATLEDFLSYEAGNKMFKIGMTRRLDPQERVNEIGSASVPFKIDVHSFIFSENAVELEKTLRKRLNDKRVNKVNLRKEFFYSTVGELEELVNELDPTAVFNKTMLAKEYNRTTSVSSDEYVIEYEDDLDDENVY